MSGLRLSNVNKETTYLLTYFSPLLLEPRSIYGVGTYGQNPSISCLCCLLYTLRATCMWRNQK